MSDRVLSSWLYPEWCCICNHCADDGGNRCDEHRNIPLRWADKRAGDDR